MIYHPCIPPHTEPCPPMQYVFVLDHYHLKSSVRRLGSNDQCYEIKNSVIGETALQPGAHLTTPSCRAWPFWSMRFLEAALGSFPFRSLRSRHVMVLTLVIWSSHRTVTHQRHYGRPKPTVQEHLVLKHARTKAEARGKPYKNSLRWSP